MAQSGRNAVRLLEQASVALARASRCRETLDLTTAQEAYLDAVQLVGQFDEADAAVRETAAEYRQQLEAERLLVEAMLHAHIREYKENIKYFGVAISAALVVSPIHAARVQCCLGSILIFEGMPDKAIEILASAIETFYNEQAHIELAQARYHQARALIDYGERTKAIELLESMQVPGDLETTMHSTTRYELAATILLALQYARQGRIKQARKLIREAANASTIAGHQLTPEGRRLKYMVHWWGAWAWIPWFQHPAAPEI